MNFLLQIGKIEEDLKIDFVVSTGNSFYENALRSVMTVFLLNKIFWIRASSRLSEFEASCNAYDLRCSANFI